MPVRPFTSMDPWQQAQDELDRQFEHAPANERPVFPPSPGADPSPAPGDEEHCAADPLDDNTGSAAVVPATKE